MAVNLAAAKSLSSRVFGEPGVNLFNRFKTRRTLGDHSDWLICNDKSQYKPQIQLQQKVWNDFTTESLKLNKSWGLVDQQNYNQNTDHL